MPLPSRLYRPSLALLTDLYELTMACAAFRGGAHRSAASFAVTFRHHPFAGGFTLAAGLADVADLVEHLRFDAEGRILPHPLNDRAIGISTEDLRRIPVLIGAASGDSKVEAIRGLLRGSLLKVLVTDAATAGVRIVGTDLRAVAHPVALAAGADPKAVEVK